MAEFGHIGCAASGIEHSDKFVNIYFFVDKMWWIVLILVVVWLWHEGFCGYKWLRITGSEVYNYRSIDGRHLRYFMRDPIRKVEWSGGHFEIWGYVGGGDAEIESVLGLPRWQKNINSNWKLLVEGGGSGCVYIDVNYAGYCIEIDF